MGGLGHLAVKLATALGGEVTVFTTSPAKVQDARRFGAKDKHDLDRFVPLLKPDATYCRVGVGKVADTNAIGQMNLVLTGTRSVRTPAAFRKRRT